jgi:hypothetical protein
MRIEDVTKLSATQLFAALYRHCSEFMNEIARRKNEGDPEVLAILNTWEGASSQPSVSKPNSQPNGKLTVEYVEDLYRRAIIQRIETLIRLNDAILSRPDWDRKDPRGVMKRDVLRVDRLLADRALIWEKNFGDLSGTLQNLVAMICESFIAWLRLNP